MSGTDENGTPGVHEKPEGGASEHLNIKVTDNNNEVFFKIKRTTALKKLMDAFCERQGKAPSSVRFLFDGSRVQATDSPDTVSNALSRSAVPMLVVPVHLEHYPTFITEADQDLPQLDMQDGDTLEVHQEQIGGAN